MKSVRTMFLSVQAAAPVIGPLVIGAVVLYLLYYLVTQAEKKFGAGTPDPGGAVAANVSLVDGAINSTLEIGHSSLSYTDAAGVVATSPVSSLEAILGINPNTPWF